MITPERKTGVIFLCAKFAVKLISMLSTIAESNFKVPKELLGIQEKVYNNERITDEEGLLLFEKAINLLR